MVRLFFIFCFVLLGCSKNENIHPKQIARIGLNAEPTSLDPRKARDLDSGIILRMLFEGLMRISKTGELEPAVVRDIEILEDGLVYIFHLRNTHWSDGSFVSASDFVYSWKQILDPQFPTDIAYHLYPIKNARKAKLGEVSLDEVGIKTRDSLTLIVELEQPTPYFLQLLTMPSFFAVPEKTALQNSFWALEGSSFVSNGPFRMKNWMHADQIVLEKNAFYWDPDQVHLDELDLLIASPDTALRMFEEGKIDWTGSPLGVMPSDAVRKLKTEKRLQSSPFLAISFFRVNMQEKIQNKANPLANINFRHALALSLDRKSIVEHLLQGGQTPAMRLVPSEMGLSKEGYFLDNQQDEAKRWLEKAKQEVDISLDPIVISYSNNERNATLAQAIQRQWQQELLIAVELEAVEPKVYFHRIAQKQFQIAIGSWTADFNDPINFLDIFKYKDNGTNNTGWENVEYIDLLNRSALCRDLEERKDLLRQAEQILMQEMPIIPIYQSAMNYLKQDALQGAYLSPQGQLDLRWAYWENR